MRRLGVTVAAFALGYLAALGPELTVPLDGRAVLAFGVFAPGLAAGVALCAGRSPLRGAPPSGGVPAQGRSR